MMRERVGAGRGWAIRWRDLWWVLAAPIYLLLGTIRHEGSHLVVGLAQGAHVVDWSVLPSKRGWGYVRFDDRDLGWLMAAAPYLCDALVFAIGYVWAFRISPRKRALFANVFVIAILSPLINSVNNYQGVFYSRGGDVGYLARVLGPATVHVFFIAAFVAYAFGIARVLTRTPVAVSGGWPSNHAFQPSHPAVTPPAEQASRQPAGG